MTNRKTKECPSCEGYGTTDWAYLGYNKCRDCGGKGVIPIDAEVSEHSGRYNPILSAVEAVKND